MTLKELRHQSKKTAAEVAGVLGVSTSAVSNYEQGIRSINVEQVLPLAKLYDVTAEELINARTESIAIRKTDKIVGRDVVKNT